MVKKICVFGISLVLFIGTAQAQDALRADIEEPKESEGAAEPEEELAKENLDDAVFWTQHVDASEEWGHWLRDIYKPYYDAVTLGGLQIVASASEVDPKGKTSEEITESINAAMNDALKGLEDIKPPVEFKQYHEKLVEIYRVTINTDPKYPDENKAVLQSLQAEMDDEMTKALKLHNVPERVIYYFMRGT